MKKLMLLGCGLMIALVLVACGDDTAGDSDTRVVTTALQASAVQVFRDDDTWDDNLWTRLIYDELGIVVDVTFTADSSTDAYSNQMNLLLASGDLPDVLRFDSREWFREAVDAGLVMDITDVFQEYASPEVLAFMERYPESFEGVTVDGRLYGFPFMNNNFHEASFFWMRDDWLEYVGGVPPQTLDEMVEMAIALSEGDPDGDGIYGNTFGFALQSNVVANNFGSIGGMLAAFGVPNYGDSGIFFRDADGLVTHSFIQPEVRYALEILNYLFEAGAIDPEFIVKDLSVLETDLALGRIGVGYHMNWGTWHPFNTVYTEDGVIVRPYPIPRAPGFEPLHGTRNNSMSEYFVIAADAAHPEAIIEIINLYYEVAVAGTQEQFLEFWADEQYRLSPIFIGIPTENNAVDIIAALEAGSSEELVGQPLAIFDLVVGFEDGSLADDMNAFGTWGQMSEYGTMRLALDYQAAGMLVADIMAGYVPESWLHHSANLVSHVQTNFVNFIIGNRSLDEFDDFIQEWLNMGGQEVLDDMNELYPN
ncbi:MAG: extracellular solute-binding protein [Turicibacter sp.]|nr:extracellular solute-binding protein [Turicibacter sp.]